MRVLVVEDELPARQRMLRLLQAEDDIVVCGQATDGETAVQLIRDTAPDLLLLDVQIPGIDGFGVLRQLAGQPLPLIVFVTAFEQYAVRAFEAHAMDYLLKPFNQKRFREMLKRARQRLAEGQQGSVAVEDLLRTIESQQRLLAAHNGGTKGLYLERFLVKHEGRTLVIPATEVNRCEAAGNFVRLYLDKQDYLVREALSRLASQLDPALFARVHRSALVNLTQVRQIETWFSGDFMITLKNGAQVKLSRNYRESFDAAVSGRLS